MKRFYLSIVLAVVALCVSAQVKKSVSVLGDSYSTFEGFVSPATNEMWYYEETRDNTDVDDVTQTWWWRFIKENGYKLCVNNSYSGSTIGYYGYAGNDYTDRSFIKRMNQLGNPDIIFVFGGTNDAWAGSPIGEYQYSDWTKDDCKNFRPALACLLDMLQKRYPKAKICSLLNSELREPINESMREVCRHYKVQLIELHDIEKQNGHPSINGMKSICDQIIEAGL